MDEFTGVDGTMSLNDVQRMQGGGPPGPGNDDFKSVMRAFLNNNEPKGVYVNYGDVNPEGHGGLFVMAKRFGSGSVNFDVFETFPADQFMDADPDEQITRAGDFYLDDMVTDDGQWTPMADPSNILGAPTTPMGAAVDNRMLYVVAGFAPEYLDPYPYRDNIHSGDYEDILDKLGVTPRQM